ncbi:hypothetical protein [Methanofollis ethanolicus]|uniref:hypothetical protein n=1 Tax=Methanofollis ethanolicus TaxID=488124 RepID=UPI000834B217|nr:hypothetical protein [Methanofollis ethanolicus]
MVDDILVRAGHAEMFKHRTDLEDILDRIFHSLGDAVSDDPEAGECIGRIGQALIMPMLSVIHRRRPAPTCG